MVDKINTFSKSPQSSPANPHVTDGNDLRFFGHSCPSPTDASRRERHGEGPARDMFDERYYSNFSFKGATHPTNDGAVARDGAGFPIYGSDISAGSHDEADRIRKRER